MPEGTAKTDRQIRISPCSARVWVRAYRGPERFVARFGFGNDIVDFALYCALYWGGEVVL